MGGDIVFEIAGYAGRIQLHTNPLFLAVSCICLTVRQVSSAPMGGLVTRAASLSSKKRYCEQCPLYPLLTCPPRLPFNLSESSYKGGFSEALMGSLPNTLRGNPGPQQSKTRCKKQNQPGLAASWLRVSLIVTHWESGLPNSRPCSANLHVHSQPLPNMGGSTVIYLETSDRQSVAGSTRAFGEIHHGDAPVVAEADDDDGFLSYCERARQVFKAQSARCFLHGFLARGSTLELWIRQLRHIPSAQQVPPRPEPIAAAESIIGLGTTCYAASASTTGQPDTAIKFSWRHEEDPTELRLLKLAHERNAWGIIRLLDHQELVTIADLRQGLDFPRPFVNRRFSSVANTPLGRPIRQFTSIPELLEVLRDLVRALQSLYVNARILHRDIAIKNLIITPQHSADSSKGTLLDFNYALDLANARPIEPMVGSDGFTAIGILSGQRHTYRHDLESLFYVFLWIAIANDRVHDEATDIVKGLPETSRLWKWCTMDFGAVGRDKAADMSPEGFEGILAEFSPDFAPLQGLARELHTLIFPVRDGKIFTGTETDPEAVQRLYDGMADAFSRSASAFQG
ncbi:predicted protein [Aspergillus terreus NIH2624]|uniref:EKC/KEOPS complex subunit BUD32 n=1 Tax=Aspergillus terreus (strain NIH 2624 / FGSC A1156) TaxID=341663 RepID=Q0C8J9_ASPTN|nr:uncharacterized protein ATEG_09985 [Aspergillus terreus NIH2624]EAU29434.1 predicted protein [Aspergillus terreus NIH2624]